MNERCSMKTSIQIQRAVQVMPAGLPALYIRMLHNIPQDQVATASWVLRCVVLTARPLEFSELAYLGEWQVPEIMELTRAARDYLKLCEPLIFITKDGKVMVIHQSVRDFLLNSKRDDDPVVDWFRVKPPEEHFELANICLKHWGWTLSSAIMRTTSGRII